MPENSVKLTVTHKSSAVSAQLTAKQELFAQAYVQGTPAVDAYTWAYNAEGSTRATCRNNAYQLLKKPHVAARIRELQTVMGADRLKSTEALIHELQQMVDADIGEALQLAVGSCRHCHGAHGAFQWVDDYELARETERACHAGEPIPDPTGGVGYVFDRAPNPECSKCQGAGIQRARFANFADCSPGVRRLFKGIELHADGSLKKVLLHDQAALRIELHKLRGMHIERSVTLHAHTTAPPLAAMTTEQQLDFLESLSPTRATAARPCIEHKAIGGDPDET